MPVVFAGNPTKHFCFRKVGIFRTLNREPKVFPIFPKPLITTIKNLWPLGITFASGCQVWHPEARVVAIGTKSRGKEEDEPTLLKFFGSKTRGLSGAFE